jgi:hypothetical protein
LQASRADGGTKKTSLKRATAETTAAIPKVRLQRITREKS